MNLKDEIKAEFYDLAINLLMSKNYKETLNLILKEIVKITHCERSCFILLNKRNELVIKAGYPESGHGIGLKLNSETGEDFLKRIIDKGKDYVFVSNPCSDSRLSYLKGLATDCNIRLVFFSPVFYEKEVLGILTVDCTNKLSADDREVAKLKIKYASDLLSKALAREFRKIKDEDNLKKRENLIVLGEESARMSHSLRNPLVSIGGFARRILKVSSEGSQIYEYAEIIKEEYQKMKKIIDDVLSFSGAVSQDVYILPQNINSILREIELKFNALHHENGKKMILELDDVLDRIKVKVDKYRIDIILQDLISNAIDAKSRCIWIKTKLNSARKIFAINIANDGLKIEPSMVDKIFNPFMTTKTNGTGLGLAIARANVESQNGKIYLRCDKGKTEFRIEIPF